MVHELGVKWNRQLKSLFNRIHSNTGDFDLMQRFCHKFSTHILYERSWQEIFIVKTFSGTWTPGETPAQAVGRSSLGIRFLNLETDPMGSFGTGKLSGESVKKLCFFLVGGLSLQGFKRNDLRIIYIYIHIYIQLQKPIQFQRRFFKKMLVEPAVSKLVSWENVRICNRKVEKSETSHPGKYSRTIPYMKQIISNYR